LLFGLLYGLLRLLLRLPCAITRTC
jgi:hypothetical protein